MAYDPSELRDPEGSSTGGRWTASPAMGSAPDIDKKSPLLSARLFRGSDERSHIIWDRISRGLAQLAEKTRNEAAVFMTPDGAMSAMVHGNNNSVNFTQNLINFMKRGGELHHSHPIAYGESLISWALSNQDLKAMAWVKGIKSIVAHGFEGSVFQASYRPGSSMAQIARSRAVDRLSRFMKVYDRAEQWSRLAYNFDVGRPIRQDIAMSHMTLVRLRDEGELDYRFKLSPGMSDLISLVKEK